MSSVTRRVFTVTAGGFLGLGPGWRWRGRRRRLRVSTFQEALTPLTCATEQTLWNNQRTRAVDALNFWNTFFALCRGAANDMTLDQAAKDRLLCIIRAISWVESKHGTAGENQPARDPMQCGNPNDSFWREINDPDHPGSRYVGGPMAPNLNANELPGRMETATGFPANAKFSFRRFGGRSRAARRVKFPPANRS